MELYLHLGADIIKKEVLRRSIVSGTSFVRVEGEGPSIKRGSVPYNLPCHKLPHESSITDLSLFFCMMASLGHSPFDIES